MCALAGVTALAAGTPRNGFEGKWILDATNGTSAADGPKALEQEIKVEGGGLKIKSKYKEPRSGLYELQWLGIMAYELNLSTDGSEQVNILGPYKHQSKTTLDGNRMVTEWVAQNEEGGNVRGQWIRTLSPDGRQMTLQVQGKISDGRSIDKTLMFRRK